LAADNAEFQRLNAHIEQLSAATLHSEQELKQRDATLAADNAEFQRLNAHIEQLSAAILHSEQELKQRDATLAADNAEFQRLNAHIEQLSAAILHSEQELKQRDATLAADNAEFQRLNAHIEQLSAAILHSEQELKQRDATLAADNAEFQRLNAHIEQLSAAILHSEQELKQRDATLAADNAEFQRLNAHIEQLSAAILHSEQELKQRDATLAADNAEFQRLNAHIEQLSAAILHSEQELKQRAAPLAADNAEFQRLNAHIEQISAALLRSEQELKQRDATLAADNAEFQRLNAHIEQKSSAFLKVQKQLTEAERHHKTETEQVREGVTQANRLLHSKNISLAESEARVTELTTRLRQQLHDAKKLTRLLGSLEDVTARLRSSRRWKLANPIVSLRNKFLRGGEPVGYDHLDKLVAAYQRWRSAHPELEDLDEQIQQLHRQASLKSSRAEFTTSAATLPSAEVNRANGSQESDRADTIAPPAPKPIAFPVFDKVEVSIIIPVFNQFHFTQACLASLQEHRGSHAIEVIVVDDGSGDETADFVPRMKGIVYLRNETNTGFVSSCNRGA